MAQVRLISLIWGAAPVSWPTFVDRYSEVLPPASPSHSEGVVVAVLIALFLTALFALFSPALRQTKVVNILSLRVGDNVKGENETPGVVTTTFFLLQGAFLLSILLEAIYADRIEGAVDISAYWLRLLAFMGVVIGSFLISCLVYRWIGAVFSGKEEMKVFQLNYMTLTVLWSVFLFVPTLMLVMDKVDLEVALGVAFIGYFLFRTVLFVRIVQIFRFSFHHPLHLFLYLCGREIAPLLLALGAFL